MKQDYLTILTMIPEICEELKRLTVQTWFTYGTNVGNSAANQSYPFAPKYRKLYDPLYNVIELCDVLGISSLESEHRELLQRVTLLGDRLDRETLEAHLAYISKVFAYNQEEIVAQLAKLEKTDHDRLNEAIHCFAEGCYFATVAMAVTVIESKLLRWMKKINPTASLDALTLGQLITKVSEDDTFSKYFPDKHKPLLKYCNQYRIFSVHPKSEEINKRVASSILNMSLEFLFDDSLG